MAFPPYCFGFSCPLKGSCNHFKEKIDIKKEIYWSATPYNYGRKKCEFYSAYPLNTIDEQLKNMLNGKKKDGE